MTFRVFLLLVLTAENFFVGVECTDADFPALVLSSDLEALSKYYEKFQEEIFAYIRWPNDVTFKVQLNPNKYLKVHGYFQLVRSCFQPLFAPYDGLFYKEGKFFLKNSLKKLKEIASNTVVSYKQPSIEIGSEVPEYLLITYFSLTEVEQDIQSFYISNKRYIDERLASQSEPSTFLAPPVERPFGQFLEYTISNKHSDQNLPMADGLVLVLTGVTERSLTCYTEGFSLVFNPETLLVTIPTFGTLDRLNIFGIRMGRTGFISKVSGKEWKLFSLRDLTVGKPAIQESKLFYELLQKVKTVEPRLPYYQSTANKEGALKSGRFQVRGQVLLKEVNLSGDRMNKDCPFSITYERHKFWVNGFGWKETICTDESKLWLQTESGPHFIETDPSA